MQRGGMDLRLPAGLTPGEINKRNFAQGLHASKELAEAYVTMKERRDDGIVSAFMNQYDKDSTAVLATLKNKYQGFNSGKVMTEFQKWRDNYIAEYSNYDEDSAKEGAVYLENKAQTRLARQKLDAYNVRDINSISTYIAAEQEMSRKNSLSASIQNTAERIMYEDNPENISISEKQLYAYISDLNRGQAKNYIDNKYRDVKEQAWMGNVTRDSATNPMASIVRYSMPEFSRDISPETKAKARDSIMKAFVNYQSQQIANASTGRASNPAGDTFYTQYRDFFGSDFKSVLEQIDENAVKLRNSMLEKDDRENRAVLGGLTSSLFDARENDDTELIRENLVAMSGVRGGKESAEIVNDVFKNSEDYSLLKKYRQFYLSGKQPTMLSQIDGAPIPPKEDVDKMMSDYYKKTFEMQGKLQPLVNEINNGKYERLTDIEDIEKYPPDQQMMILKTFVHNTRYDSLADTASKQSGVDYNSIIEKMFEDHRGSTIKKPIEFNNYKFEMIQKIKRYMDENEGKVPGAKELQQMSNTSATADQNIDVSVKEYFLGLSKEVDKENQYAGYGEKVNAMIDSLSKTLPGKTSSAEAKIAIRRAAEYIVDGRLPEAADVLGNAGALAYNNNGKWTVDRVVFDKDEKTLLSRYIDWMTLPFSYPTELGRKAIKGVSNYFTEE